MGVHASVLLIKRWRMVVTLSDQRQVSPIQFKYFNKYSWSEKLSTRIVETINVEITEGLLLKDTSDVKDRLLNIATPGLKYRLMISVPLPLRFLT